jgi:hypothetical protein
MEACVLRDSTVLQALELLSTVMEEATVKFIYLVLLVETEMLAITELLWDPRTKLFLTISLVQEELFVPKANSVFKERLHLMIALLGHTLLLLG